jgi:putative PIN family toxin of toxin-antitoxin system
VVVDANIVVSAIFGGVPAKALWRAFEGDVYISPDVESEWNVLGEKLERKIHPDRWKVWKETFLPSIVGRMHRVEVREALLLCRDPKDNAYLSLAKAAQADFLVTGDKDLHAVKEEVLAKAGLSFLRILTPRQFLANSQLKTP